MIPPVDFGSIDVFRLFLWLVVLFGSLSFHESAHAWSADRLGDPTARLLGRVTLNPWVHIDLVGTVIFPLLTALAGGVIFGWAKPVPVNTANLSRPRRDHAWIAAAGPASNLLLALACLVGLNLMLDLFSARTIGTSEFLWPLAQLFQAGLLINVVLAVFNLFPIPPLDGGWILGGFLPEALARAIDTIRPYGFLLLLALLYTGIFYRVIDPVLGFVFGLLPQG